MKTTITTIINHLRRLYPLLALVFLFLWLRSCHKAAQQASRYETNLRATQTKIRSYRLSNGQLAQEKALLLVTREELKEQVWVKDDSLQLLLKKLNDPLVTVKWKTQYVYDTVYIPFDTPVPAPFRRNFSKTGEWYSLSGTVDQNGISIDKLSIPNVQRLVVGYQKGNPIVRVTNSNPYLTTEAMEGQIIKIPKRHWVLGVGGIWNIYEPPSGGFFLGYKIIEF